MLHLKNKSSLLLLSAGLVFTVSRCGPITPSVSKKIGFEGQGSSLSTSPAEQSVNFISNTVILARGETAPAPTFQSTSLIISPNEHLTNFTEFKAEGLTNIKDWIPQTVSEGGMVVVQLTSSRSELNAAMPGTFAMSLVWMGSGNVWLLSATPDSPSASVAYVQSHLASVTVYAKR